MSPKYMAHLKMANEMQKNFFMVSLTVSALLGASILAGGTAVSMPLESIKQMLLAAPVFLVLALLTFTTVVYTVLYTVWVFKNLESIFPTEPAETKNNIGGAK
jgi:formate hydrogenlyase subunit 3/multisubunit Na+/H+ antiporter MnhD subunit